MDLDAAVARFNAWLDLLFDIHQAHSDPVNPESQRSRVKAELLPFYLVKADWSGDATFSLFHDRLKPSVATKNKADQLAQLVRRRFFKAERWSAPEVGGVARCLVGSAIHVMEGIPDLVFDLAEIGDNLRIVAMHEMCPECAGSGVDGNEPFTYIDLGGGACLGGLISRGGLALDLGVLEESEIFDADVLDPWKHCLEG